MKKWVLAFTLVFTLGSFAQPPKFEKEIFQKRREVFMQRMQKDAIAIFPAKPVYQRNLDIEYPYRQENNFYYLSGFEEPNAIMVINPSHPKYKFILFVEKRAERASFYVGNSAGIRGAMETFGADTAFYTDEFDREIYWIIRGDRTIYYTFGINPEVDRKIEQLFIERRSMSNYPIIDPHPIVAEMRLIKNEDDWKAGLQRAIDISVAGMREAIKAVKPGRYEYEVQAVLEYVYRKNGSLRDAYPPIIGSGPNSGVLHYSANNRQMQDGEVVLLDCAAEYGYYSADITRTVPVNGKFSPEQKQIYELVLRAQEAAIAAVRPGLVKVKLDSIIEDILGEGLLKLGFIKKKSHFPLFTLHKYSHWIGLDVHDVGGYTRDGKSIVLQPGMVFTIEPGIYVRPDVLQRMERWGYSDEEIEQIGKRIEKYLNIGVRIEDDILVTADGHKNLTAGVPRKIRDIEKLMKKKGVGE